MGAGFYLNSLDNCYFFGLRSFWAASDFKLNVLAFIQRFVAAGAAQDITEMYENVRTLFLFDKTETFVGVKPFNGASSHCRGSHDESYKFNIKP